MGGDGSVVGRGDRVVGAQGMCAFAELWVVLILEIALFFAFSMISLGRCAQSPIERFGSVLS
jgi:hypothetical protein